MAKFKFAEDVRAKKHPEGGWLIHPDDVIVGENLSRFAGAPLDIEELSKSLKADGKQIQPGLCRPDYTTGRPVLVAGARRLAAVKWVNETETAQWYYWCLLEDMSEGEAAQRDLRSNDPKQLGPMDKAVAYGNVMRLNNWTQAQLAEWLGKTDAHVSQYLGLLNLADEVKQELAFGRLTLQEALSFKGLSREKQAEVVEKKGEESAPKVAELVAAAKREENTSPQAAGESRAEPRRKAVKSAAEIKKMLTEGIGEMNPAFKTLCNAFDLWVYGETGDEDLKDELQTWSMRFLSDYLQGLKDAGKIVMPKEVGK